MKALVDGQEVTVGDVVCFKSDIEQSGVIVEIKQSYSGKALPREQAWVLWGLHWRGNNNHRASQGLLDRLTEYPKGAILCF